MALCAMVLHHVTRNHGFNNMLKNLTDNQKHAMFFWYSKLIESNRTPMISEYANYANLAKNSARMRVIGCVRKGWLSQDHKNAPYQVTLKAAKRLQEAKEKAIKKLTDNE